MKKILLITILHLIFLTTIVYADCLPSDAFDFGKTSPMPSYKWGVLSQVSDITTCSNNELNKLIFIRNTTAYPGAADVLNAALEEAQDRGLNN